MKLNQLSEYAIFAFAEDPSRVFLMTRPITRTSEDICEVRVLTENYKFLELWNYGESEVFLMSATGWEKST